MAITIDGAGTITGISEGGLDDGIITENELVAAVTPIGVGQTWQNVTASRQSGVTFTNSTGRPIVVSISINTQNAVEYFINGVRFFRANASATGAGACTTFIVPDGATYLTDGGFLIWSELR